jgi:hypothetical protein
VIAARLAVTSALALVAGCGPRIDVGSDLLWTSRFETGDFGEWSDDGGGSAISFPEGNNRFEIATERPHRGAAAARLTIDTSTAGSQQNVLLGRASEELQQAFYSAWYYLPRSVTVRTYWVIFKLQMQDPSTVNQLYDLDLVNLPSGEMSLMLYDHRAGAVVTLDVTDPVVPVGQWFHLEAFYRNARDGTGRATFWLDGRQVIDIPDPPMAPTPWVEWDACSVGEDLNPTTAVIYVDDCAISRSRVGPTGILSAP